MTPRRFSPRSATRRTRTSPRCLPRSRPGTLPLFLSISMKHHPRDFQCTRSFVHDVLACAGFHKRSLPACACACTSATFRKHRAGTPCLPHAWHTLGTPVPHLIGVHTWRCNSCRRAAWESWTPKRWPRELSYPSRQPRKAPLPTHPYPQHYSLHETFLENVH